MTYFYVKLYFWGVKVQWKFSKILKVKKTSEFNRNLSR